MKITVAVGWLLSSLFAFGSFAVPVLGDDPTTAPAKAPVPDAAAVKDAQKLVGDLYANDIVKARKPKEKAELAKKLLQSAIDTKNDAAGKYVLLGMAKDTAVQAGDVDMTFSAIDELVKAYQVEDFKLKTDALGKLSKTSGVDRRSVIEKANVLIDEALAAERYDTANQAAELAAGSARATKDLDCIKAANLRVQEVRSAESAYQQVKKAFATLADTPKDPQANLVVGRFYCLVKSEWEKGLPMLASGSDAALQAMAQKELAHPTDADKQVELANGWWALADKETAAAQRSIREHAAGWYEEALPNLTGLEKAKVDKRLAEIGTTNNGSPGQKWLTLDLGNKVTMKLVRIPAGKFVMGSPNGEQGRAENEGPQHEVAISKPFHMGVYTVTQEQYAQVMGRNPSHFKDASNPVDSVSWDDSVEFCNRVSKKTGRKVALPTEAQWEYACRAGTTTPFNTGATLSADQANYNQAKTTSVGKFTKNAFGIYDMHGNVWQWCSDWFDERYYATSPKTDPQGPKGGGGHVLRGGGYYFPPVQCRSASRYWGVPSNRPADFGFRVVVLPDVSP